MPDTDNRKDRTAHGECVMGPVVEPEHVPQFVENVGLREIDDGSASPGSGAEDAEQDESQPDRDEDFEIVPEEQVNGRAEEIGPSDQSEDAPPFRGEDASVRGPVPEGHPAEQKDAGDP